jgi:hypothetical protein
MEKIMRTYDNYEKPMLRKVDLARTTEPPVKSHPPVAWNYPLLGNKYFSKSLQKDVFLYIVSRSTKS